MYGLDLFSGIGGISKALDGYVRPVAYCEIEPYARAVLLSRMHSGDIPLAPIWDDVSTLRGAMLPHVDIIYGGFPCQDISVAGRGAGLGGERSGLFFEIVRLVREIKPQFVFLENVPAIRRRGLDRVLEELTSLGYDCRWGMLSAADVGANHKRERWFLLAGRRPAMDDPKSRELRHDGSNKRAPAGEIDPSAGPSPLLADADDAGQRVCLSGGTPCDGGAEAPKGCCEHLPNSLRSGLEGQREESSGAESKQCDARVTRWWDVEPPVGRVANGVSKRVDRLRALGNAVVPAQAREAFERLMGLK